MQENYFLFLYIKSLGEGGNKNMGGLIQTITKEVTEDFKPTSDTNELNKKDWKRWLRNLFIFSIPTLLAFLYALQGFITNENHLPTSIQIWVAVGGAYQTLLASLIDLFIKYKKEA